MDINLNDNMRYIDDSLNGMMMNDLMKNTCPGSLRFFNKKGPIAVFGEAPKIRKNCKRYGCNGLGNTRAGSIYHRSARYCPKSEIKTILEKSKKILKISMDIKNDFDNLENLKKKEVSLI